MWVIVLSLLEGEKGSGFAPRNNKVSGMKHSITVWEGDRVALTKFREVGRGGVGVLHYSCNYILKIRE